MFINYSPRIIFCICLTAAIFAVSSFPSFAQMPESKQNTGVLIGGKATDIEQKIYPFGDGFTTAAQAKALLNAEGLTYIGHSACRVSYCDSDALIESPEKMSDLSSDGTMFILTGFHPKKGAVTIVLYDLPCVFTEVQNPKKVSRPQLNSSNCFAGYHLLWRTFHDFYFDEGVDGWGFAIFQRIQVPTQFGDKPEFGNLSWRDVGTLEIRKEVFGEEASGMTTATRTRFSLPDGTIVGNEENSWYTIASTGGKEGKAPKLPNFSSLPNAEQMGTSVTISKLSDKILECEKEAENKARIDSPDIVKKGEKDAIISYLASLGMKKGTFGSGSAPGGNIEFELPGEMVTEGIRRITDADIDAVRGKYYFECRNRDKEDEKAEVEEDTSVFLLLENGQDEQPIESIASWTFPSSTCESWSTKESYERDGLYCTTTITVTCDEDCNCSRTENEVCTD